MTRAFVRRGHAVAARDGVSLDVGAGEFVTIVGPSGYVTQADNLYPWLTLRENLEFALEVRGVPRAERRRRAAVLRSS